MRATRDKRRATILILLAAWACAHGATLVTVADPNACYPTVYDPNRIPFPVEPNAIAGRLLPWVPGDPNGFYAPAGKAQRIRARACDPNDDPMAIEYVGGTSPAEPHYDPNTGTWAPTCEILIGLNVLWFLARDQPVRAAEPNEAEYTIVVWGLPRPNTPPVLH